jgi:hypothetical protein
MVIIYYKCIVGLDGGSLWYLIFSKGASWGSMAGVYGNYLL